MLMDRLSLMSSGYKTVAVARYHMPLGNIYCFQSTAVPLRTRARSNAVESGMIGLELVAHGHILRCRA